MIERQTATVFFAPTTGRRFLTLRAAVKAEARSRLDERYNEDEIRGHNLQIIYPAESWKKYDADNAWTKETQKLFDSECAKVMAEYLEAKKCQEN